MMTIKNIETAYEEIYDFLDEIDSHPLSAQISLPIPDLVDGVWVDKYFVYEDISISGKHIAPPHPSSSSPTYSNEALNANSDSKFHFKSSASS